MSGFQSTDMGDTSADTVLLVMLATQGHRDETSHQLIAVMVFAAPLGPATQLLQIDEATYPAVVRSFAPTELPTCVLMHQGVELWWQPGLPDAEQIVALMKISGQVPVL